MTLRAQNETEYSDEELDSKEIREAIANLLWNYVENKVAAVYVGEVQGSDPMMQADSRGTTIFIQPGWIGQALFELENADIQTYNIHLVLGTIKLIHEFVNCLTPKILETEHQLRSYKNEKAIPVSVTPETVGFVFGEKKRNKGDMGFAAEELMSGGFRFYPRIDDSSNIPFKFIGLMTYKLIVTGETGKKKFERFDVADEESFITNVLGDSFDITKVFAVEVARPRDNEEEEEDWEASFEGYKPYIAHTKRDSGRVE